MSLNIKNPRVHALAREAAERSGRSQTSVIEVALQEYLERLGPEGEQARLARLRRLYDDARRTTTDAERDAMHRDVAGLYDEQGMPA